jgi:hypothetical protein
MEVAYLDLVGEGYMGSSWGGLPGKQLGRATWEAVGEGYMGSMYSK